MEEEALINAMKSLVVGGWKCDNGFMNGYLSQLEAHNQRAFPHSNIKAEPHITSKLYVWKKQYSTIVTMMSKSGLGWDDSRCMVTVEDNNAWEEVLEKEFGDPDQRVTVLDAVNQLPGLQHKDCLLVARRFVRDPKDMEFFFSLGVEDKMDLVRLMLDGGF
ncbi:hypothetical protein Sango_1184100 [Sesamum angolense]|uniref:Myb/SANT-like domain-containing protein n=1 Tax=Sesamum angolense TaxID=2727404 RepID=A0AAE1WW77_9LAMI|nr:hypothetical protein Sango_1184100 [Sesamum angolense]